MTEPPPVPPEELRPASISTKLSPQDIDVPGRKPVALSFATALVWLLIGSFFGDVASLKFQYPDWLTGSTAWTFGNVRSAHLNAMAYGWASLAMIGVSLWLVPRLIHTPLRLRRLALTGIAIWNVGLVVGVGSILLGHSDGVEWLEMNRRYADPLFVLGGGCIGISVIATLLHFRSEHLYVSIWYIASAFLWFPILFVLGNLPVFRGSEHAAVNWFYAHNVLGFWLTPICIGAVYYFIPKVLGRPIYSYGLSLLGFWSLAFFYSLNGMHHLIGGPLPTWMITTSIVASMMMIIPVAAVAVNHHMTMVGRFGALRYSPTLRFVVVGAIAYTAVSVQGSFTAFTEVNRVTHFTHWTIAHSHVGLYAFVTMVMFGSMYYIVPRLTGGEWPSGRLISIHFWLAIGGIAAYVIALSIGGVQQGLAMLDPKQPFQASAEAARPWLVVRTVAGFMLTAAHGVFVAHVVLAYRRKGQPGSVSWHRPRPIEISLAGKGRP
ncbi:MAG TPA: cbb3-type cytochrome c oxidase subunit I [Kofleriaceae bacterium]|jgi:cytochrome c oxidase cbb3-type subunit 1|nr:cbb3-type cytochrome c oxidase subunit I [Kofleriaceae bacterium]